MAAEAATHGAEAAVPFPPFDPTLYPSQLFWFVVSFGALYFIMSRFVLPKIGRVIEKREGAVKSDLDTAASNSADAEKTRTATEEAIAKARADGRAVVEQRRAAVQAELNAEQEKAEAAIAQRIGAAETQIGAARARAMTEVDGLAKDLAASIVAKLLPANAAAPRAV